VIRLYVFFLLMISSAVGVEQKTALPEIPPAEAGQHIIAQSNPTYPAIAKAKSIQGKVLLRVTITTEGHVSNVRVISGHPFLIAAAIEAVKKWEYRPFIVNGVPGPVDTVLEVPFALVPDVDYQKIEMLSQDYFKKFDQCRDLVQKRLFEQGENVCKSAVEASLKLPESRGLERVSAHQWAGHSLFYQRKFQAALPLYLGELKSAETCLTPADSEYAYALRDIARAYHGIGDYKNARSYYERAETSLRAARDHIESPFLKNEYSKALQGVLRDYVAALRQAGHLDAANGAEKRANEIVIKEGLKDD
jgi:TonB family protein